MFRAQRKGDSETLKALAEVSAEECFGDPSLRLDFMKGLVQGLDKGYDEGEVGDELLCDAV